MLCQVRIDKFDTKRESGVSPEPVTVFGESVFNIPLHNPIMIHVRRGGQTFVSVSQETCLAYEMSFRAKLNIRQPGTNGACPT